MRIFLSGYYGAKNLGDELLLLKVVEDILTVIPEAEFFVWSLDKDFTNRFLKDYSVSAVGRFEVENTVKAIKGSDVVVLGGGGIVQEYYGIRIEDLFKDFGYHVVSYAIPPLLGKIFNKKVFYWCLGHGPVITEDAWQFSRWFYSLADVITLRDELSYSLVKEIVPDAKVFLDTDPLLNFNFQRYSIEKEEAHLLGVSVRKWFNEEKLVEKVVRTLKKLVESEGVKIFLIPCDLSLDLEVVQKIKAHLPGEALFEFEFKEIEDVVKAVSLCSWFLGMRLHSLICAYRLGVPFLALSYDAKTEEFVRLVGADWVKVTELTEDELFLKLRTLMRSKPLEQREFPYKSPLIFKAFVEGESFPKQEKPKEVESENRVQAYLQDFVKTLLQQREELERRIYYYQQRIAELEARNEELRARKEELEARNEELRAQNEELRAQRDQYFAKLNEIYTSNFWRVARTYYTIRDKTPLRYLYYFFKLKGKYKGKDEVKDVVGSSFDYDPYDLLEVLKPIEVKVVETNFKVTVKEVKFSVIIPVRNEGSNIYEFLRMVACQTIKPDEVIVVESHSKDNTVAEIERYQRDYGHELKLELIISKEEGPAKNRNLGIAKAKNELLLFLDAGIDIEKELFERMIATYLHFPEADLVAGIYEPKIRNEISSKFVWDWQKIDFSLYIPSSRCLLVKRSKVQSIGGYPEFLPYTGEDTLFAIRYRKVSNLWVINKAIKVWWHAPTNKEDGKRKAFYYGWGDGLIGFGDFRYYRSLKEGGFFSKFLERDEIAKEHYRGYLKGREERSALLEDSVEGLWLVLSLVPLTDSGGGQRATQLSLELMKNRCKVVFVNAYPSFEEKRKIFLDVEPELLELYYVKDFDFKDFLRRHKPFKDKTFILLEAPHPELLRIATEIMKENRKAKLIYDCIDNWDSSLGWTWYNKELEKYTISIADYIITSAKTLKERLRNMTSKEVYLLPNAVNTRLFRIDMEHQKPQDLPYDKPIVMYVGALWGEWFDWELITKIAGGAEVNIVLIGNAPEEKMGFLKNFKNVYYLGLKPQFVLPNYLSQAKVGLIPFKYDDKIIKYTNPLKVYEYLAMGLPVVATYMDELENLPCVFLAKGHEEFISNLRQALTIEFDKAQLREFVEKQSWQARVKELFRIVSLSKA